MCANYLKGAHTHRHRTHPKMARNHANTAHPKMARLGCTYKMSAWLYTSFRMLSASLNSAGPTWGRMEGLVTNKGLDDLSNVLAIRFSYQTRSQHTKAACFLHTAYIFSDSGTARDSVHKPPQPVHNGYVGYVSKEVCEGELVQLLSYHRLPAAVGVLLFPLFSPLVG